MEKQSNEEQSYAFTPDSHEVGYQSIPDRLREIAKICPEREAIVFLSTNGERNAIKYNDLYQQAQCFAKGLAENGVKRNDVVGISNKNCVEWEIATVGVQMVGAIPLHFFFKRQDGSDVLGTLSGIPRCTLLIIDAGTNDNNISICRNIVSDFQPDGFVSSTAIPDLCKIMLMKPSKNWPECSTVQSLIIKGKTSPSALPLLSPDDTAAIFLTSGSTGAPKAIPQTHISLLRSGMDFANYMELEPCEYHYNDRPFSWLGGYPCAFLLHMTTRVTASDIMALKTLNEINEFTVKSLEKENCTSALIITPCLHDMLHTQVPSCKQWPLKVIATGGLPVESSCTKAAGVIAKRVVVMYGATEVGFISSISVTRAEDFEDYSVGYPAPGVELKIVDDDGNIVPIGTAGEIYFRSRDRFQGYINNKERTALCCDKTGWYKTDDIGVLRQNGNFVVKGRKSDMMIIGGLLVSPLYVENIVKRHPRVVDAYIYPVHDDKMYQRAYAAVVVNPHGTLTEQDLKNFILEQQSGNKDSFLEQRYIPEHFIFFEDLPHTHNGKLDRKATAMKINAHVSLSSG